MENDERRSLRGKITEYIRKRYGAEPERLWLRWPDYTVFRHADNEKWFGIIMDVSRERLGPVSYTHLDLRGAVLSTRGPGWTHQGCIGCRASGTAG